MSKSSSNRRPARARVLAYAAAAVTVSALTSPATAANGPYVWVGGTGNFNDPAMWRNAPNPWPPTTAWSGSIDGNNPVASVVNVSGSATGVTLSIDAGDALALAPGASLQLDAATLDGTIQFGSAAGGTSGAQLRCFGLTSPAGAGTIVFGASGLDSVISNIPAGVTVRAGTGGGTVSGTTTRGTIDADAPGGTVNVQMAGNYGLLRTRNGATLGLALSSFTVGNQGTIQVDVGGTVRLSGVNSQLAGETHVDGLLTGAVFKVTGGRLTGTGTVASDTEVAGTLAPGPGTGDLNGAGTLHVHNIHPQWLNPQPMRTVLEIFGTGDAQYDRVVTDFKFELGGIVELVRQDGFAAAEGDTFTIASGSVQNPLVYATFTRIVGQDAGNGLRFAPVVDGASSIELVAALPGDANLDHRVDYADFLLLKANYKSATVQYGDGNFDGDDVVGPGDFEILLANLGLGAGQALTPAQLADVQAFAVTVPEPAALAASLLACAAVGRRRRR